MKDLVSRSANEQGRQILQNIAKLGYFMLRGEVNEEILKLFYGVNLYALTKKYYGLAIAVCCEFRRLTAKICCQSVQEKCKAYFQPFYLGFATAQGCETIVH